MPSLLLQSFQESSLAYGTHSKGFRHEPAAAMAAATVTVDKAAADKAAGKASPVSAAEAIGLLAL